jgi:hypothetical protein
MVPSIPGRNMHGMNNHVNSRVMFPNAATEVRKVDPDYVEGQQQTFFSDGYPFLLASQVSQVVVRKSSLNLIERVFTFYFSFIAFRNR